MTGRDSNRGQCAQPCRYQYALMEEKRPGEYFPVFEDEKGTYIMNSRDMCMIDHLGDIMDAGIDCIKIEGRAKSAYYAAIVTGAYRHVLDDVAAGRDVDPVWRDEVEHVSHRHYSTGFYYGQPGQYYDNSRYIRDWQVCAVVTDCDADGNATLSHRNKFAAGDEIELVGPDCRPFTMTAPVMHDLEGFELYEPRTPQTVFKMKLPRYVPPMSFVRHAVSLSAKDLDAFSRPFGHGGDRQRRRCCTTFPAKRRGADKGGVSLFQKEIPLPYYRTPARRREQMQRCRAAILFFYSALGSFAAGFISNAQMTIARIVFGSIYVPLYSTE